MKILLFVLILATSWTQALAQDPHYTPPDPVVTTTTINETTEVTNITSADGNYGLMALAASGLTYDWGVPTDLQWAAAGSFSEGGNQAIAAGLGMRFGAVLLTANFVTVLDPDDTANDITKANDYALIISGSGRF